MAKPTHVTVVLTLRQAKAMQFALQNTTGHEDAMEAVFPNKHERNACYRADEEVHNAIARYLREAG